MVRMLLIQSLSLAVAMGLLASGGMTTASAQPGLTLLPAKAHTVGQSRCGAATLSTASTNCQGFDARAIREQPDIFVVGYESDQDVSEKHVLQVVLVFDLGTARPDPGAQLSGATLHYIEGSTARRSTDGTSQDGILQTCNSGLGVPTGEWDGRTDTIVPTRPAVTAGVAPATTGDGGSWNVTPQVNEWLAGGKSQGTLVLRGDDETLDVRGQAMCLSYVADLGLSLEYAPIEP